MMKTLQSWEQLKLWPHQRQAVEMIRRYQSARVDGQALVRMPTGTGKTGVMAIVAQCFPETVDVLIVAPWAQLTGQIAYEIETGFWQKLGMKLEQATKKAKTFRPSTLESALSPKKSEAPVNILICTNQTLERVYAINPAYEMLRKRVSLVLVDEGHREPAPAWAEAVRQLKKPTVLFTATPYRNDQRWFEVDSDFIFRLSHSDAVDQHFIRKVEFHDMSFGENAGSFVKALLDFYHGDFQKLKPSTVSKARVIVRCETDSEITAVADALEESGEKYVAVHENYSDREESARLRRVPNPKENDATFWVHQNKLMEGIDDPAFSLLAIYQPFGNARSLVQQIGRIIRNPSLAAGQVAHVLSNKKHKQRRFWESYLRYEERLGGSSNMNQVGTNQILDDFLQLHEIYHYIDGNFRDRFDPKSAKFHQHLKYSLSTNVYQKHRGYTFNELLESIRKVINEEDYILLNEAEPDARTHVFLYSRCNASPLLIDQTFMEVSLGVAVVRETDKFVFHYDSEKLTPEYLTTHAERVPAGKLEGLLSGEKVRITQISLLNSDLALYSVRRRSLSAYSITHLAPALADYAHFCSTASGVIQKDENNTRRYVGFTRARISDRSVRFIEYDDYIEWIDSIDTELKRRGRGATELFDRYALNVVSKGKHKAAHILFDIEDVEEDYLAPRQSEDGEEDVPASLFDDSCWDVDDAGRFICTSNGKQFKATVIFDHPRKRFEITSKDMVEEYPHNGLRNGRRRNIVAHLNYMQCFRVITDTGLIYAHGQFYSSRMPMFGKKLTKSIDLRQILFKQEELNSITTEKGEARAKTAHNGTKEIWDKGSIFEYIAREDSTSLFASENFKPDILICDDLGTELADFIAAQSNPPRVCMIHAKADKKKSSLSASAFHEVCGQAVKNLGLLNPQWGQRPKKLEIWDGPWIHKKIGSVERRIRLPRSGLNAEAAWEKIERIIRHPAAVREVWVVMSDGMSRKAFVRRQKENTPPPSVIQLIYLLQSTWSAVSSVGAVFKVFCKP